MEKKKSKREIVALAKKITKAHGKPIHFPHHMIVTELGNATDLHIAKNGDIYVALISIHEDSGAEENPREEWLNEFSQEEAEEILTHAQWILKHP